MMFNWLDLLCSVLGLTCVFLAGRGSKYNFWVGYLYTIALFFLFLQKNLVASLLLQPVSLGINILGHYRWTHPKAGEASSEKSGELKVTMLTWPERALTVVVVLVVSYLLSKGNDVTLALMEKNNITESTSKLIGACCIVVYILVIGAAASILYTEVAKLIKKK